MDAGTANPIVLAALHFAEAAAYLCGLAGVGKPSMAALE
jgi:hypothetical protein